jgi:alkaline phosphatase D
VAHLVARSTGGPAFGGERAEILDFLRTHGITGMVAIRGDRHAFGAGVLSSSLAPGKFAPVAAEFTTGSISAPGLFEAAEYRIPKDHPLRAVYLFQGAPGASIEPSMNMSVMHGVRASLALQRTGSVRQALSERNPDLAPHLSFADLGGHGYAVVHATKESLEVEFVCIPRPLERDDRSDGGPLTYRVIHRLKLWRRGDSPRLERSTLEGSTPLDL